MKHIYLKMIVKNYYKKITLTCKRRERTIHSKYNLILDKFVQYNVKND